MKFIDLAKQQSLIKEGIQNRIEKVLKHGKYIMGPEVYDLEEKLANYVGAKHCITCSSGTDALLIALMAKGIGHGDAILTTPFSFIATAEVISLVHANPIFVDIDPETFNINPNNIQKALIKAKKKGLNPRAIITVDLFGLPSRYRIIEEIAKKQNLFLLEDAAQGFGGEIRGKKACNFGDVSATSFFPAKPLGCYGDGGAIFTNNDELCEIMKSIRIHGSGNNKYDNIRVGLNGRLDTFQAAVLLEKLTIFEDEISKRNQIADYYRNNLPNQYKEQKIPKNYVSSFAQFSILTESKQHRNIVLKKFADKNLPANIYYQYPLHLQKVFKKLEYKTGDFPYAEKIADRIFSIPMHPYLTKNQQDIILELLHAVAK